jgi:hypothetical protein
VSSGTDIALMFLYTGFIYLISVLTVFKAYFLLFYSLKPVCYMIIFSEIKPFNYYSFR